MLFQIKTLEKSDVEYQTQHKEKKNKTTVNSDRKDEGNTVKEGGPTSWIYSLKKNVLVIGDNT